MGIEALMGALESGPRGGGRWDARTTNSIKAAVLHELANDKRIVGEQEFSEGYLRLVEATATDSELNTAVEIISRKILEIFPNKTEAPSNN